jgi:putative cell wall-binding protein
MAPRAKRQTQSKERWSGEVTKHSHALDLDQGVFTWSSPQKIASSLKRSAETSTQRKAKPYQSAMSMLNFFLNRAGRGLSTRQKKVLERAKDELRKLFGREPR